MVEEVLLDPVRYFPTFFIITSERIRANILVENTQEKWNWSLLYYFLEIKFLSFLDDKNGGKFLVVYYGLFSKCTWWRFLK